MGVQGYLISTRFLSSIGHLTTLFLLFSTIQNNIEVSLGDNATTAQYAQAYQSSIAALILGIVCFTVDFSGIFMGTSLFNHTVNLIQILFHFVGGVFLSLLITENFGYQALWPIIVATNIPPTMAEIFMLVRIYVLKSTPY